MRYPYNDAEQRHFFSQGFDYLAISKDSYRLILPFLFLLGGYEISLKREI